MSSASAVPVRRRIELALAAVGQAGARLDIAFIENSLSTRLRLCLVIFNMSSNSAMVRPGRRVDEMQDTMMRAAEPISLEQPVGIADEIAIGEEQKLDQIEHRLGSALADARGSIVTSGLRARPISFPSRSRFHGMPFSIRTATLPQRRFKSATLTYFSKIGTRQDCPDTPRRRCLGFGPFRRCSFSPPDMRTPKRGHAAAMARCRESDPRGVRFDVGSALRPA